jgi:hypothetical protein
LEQHLDYIFGAREAQLEHNPRHNQMCPLPGVRCAAARTVDKETTKQESSTMTAEAFEEVCDVWAVVIRTVSAGAVAFAVVFGALTGATAGLKVLTAQFPVKPRAAAVEVAGYAARTNDFNAFTATTWALGQKNTPETKAGEL